jgi:sugar phosphate isomerase/epimerase
MVAARDGLLDPTRIERAGNQPWNYVTLSLGHPQGKTFWADFVYQLCAAGYDGVLSIKQEDTLVSARGA